MVRLQGRSSGGSSALGKRTLSNALTFNAGAIRYAVKTQGPLRGAKVTLLHMLDGTLRVRFKDRDLAFTPFLSHFSGEPKVELRIKGLRFG